MSSMESGKKKSSSVNRAHESGPRSKRRRVTQDDAAPMNVDNNNTNSAAQTKKTIFYLGTTRYELIRDTDPLSALIRYGYTILGELYGKLVESANSFSATCGMPSINLLLPDLISHAFVAIVKYNFAPLIQEPLRVSISEDAPFHVELVYYDTESKQLLISLKALRTAINSYESGRPSVGDSAKIQFSGVLAETSGKVPPLGPPRSASMKPLREGEELPGNYFETRDRGGTQIPMESLHALQLIFVTADHAATHYLEYLRTGYTDFVTHKDFGAIDSNIVTLHSKLILLASRSSDSEAFGGGSGGFGGSGLPGFEVRTRTGRSDDSSNLFCGGGNDDEAANILAAAGVPMSSTSEELRAFAYC